MDYRESPILRYETVLTLHGEIELPVREQISNHGERLRQFRRVLGITLGDAARVTGLELYQISLLECGEAAVDEEAYVAALEACAKEKKNG